jgi:hypothetical protein
MKTLIFKVRENADTPFVAGGKYSVDNLVKLNWKDAKDDLYLTRLLNQQCIITQIHSLFLGHLCFKAKEYEYGNYIPTLKIKDEYFGILLTPEKREKICKTFDQYRAYAYRDLLNRDQKVLNDQFKNNKIRKDVYAVVLLNDYKYVGHVYCWFNGEYAFMMGIRSDPLNSLKENEVKGVASYILEAVRKFSILNGAKSLIVPYAMAGMSDKLRKLAFHHSKIEEDIMGISPLLGRGPCSQCQIKKDLTQVLGIPSIMEIF